MRPDYCPMANEPCQSMCDTPCSAHRLKIATVSPQPTPELVQDVNQPDSTLGLLAYAANWIANPSTRKVSAGKLAAWLWNASHTHPGGKDDVDFWIKQATDARQAENQLIREMSDLVKAARQALDALKHATPKDSQQAGEQLEAIAALQNALMSVTDGKGTTNE